jgi:hypothetical protein
LYFTKITTAVKVISGDTKRNAPKIGGVSF